MEEHKHQIGDMVVERETGATGVVLERKWWVALFSEAGIIKHPLAEPAYWVRFTDGREKNILESELV